MDLDQQVANAGKLQVIDEIDSKLRAVSDIQLNKFLSKFDHTYMDRNKPKGPDYLIMDNFFENFDLNEADLLGARKDVVQFSNKVCGTEVAAQYRCDIIAWIKGFSDQYYFPSIYKVYNSVVKLKPLLNQLI